jgi:hypothetical protein
MLVCVILLKKKERSRQSSEKAAAERYAYGRAGCLPLCSLPGALVLLVAWLRREHRLYAPMHARRGCRFIVGGGDVVKAELVAQQLSRRSACIIG